MFSLASPWCLLALLIPIAVRIYKLLRRHQKATIAYSSLANARTAGKSWKVRLAWLPAALFDLTFVALAIALARPQSSVTTTQAEDASEGIAIEMVMDRSGSMYQDMAFNGMRTTRLETVKAIFSLFVFGDEQQHDFKGRQGDLVGLVTFAKTAETNCPLTLGHDALKQALDTIQLINPEDLPKVQNALNNGLDLNSVLLATGKRQLYNAFAHVYGQDQARPALEYYLQLNENNMTAIGDALALGIARLKQADADAKDYKIKSKVLILLTDGENNHGREVASVISFAKDSNVKVHVIAIGEASRFNADDSLKQLADATGGSYTQADSADELIKVYADIDSMERSKITDKTFTNTTELFQPVLLIALALLFLHILLSTTLFRTLP